MTKRQESGAERGDDPERGHAEGALELDGAV